MSEQGSPHLSESQDQQINNSGSVPTVSGAVGPQQQEQQGTAEPGLGTDARQQQQQQVSNSGGTIFGQNLGGPSHLDERDSTLPLFSRSVVSEAVQAEADRLVNEVLTRQMELSPGAALYQLEEGVVQAKQKLELAKKQFSALCSALNHNNLDQEGDELQTAVLLAKQAKIDKLDFAVKLAMKELQQAETALSYHTGKIPDLSNHSALSTSLEDMDPDRSNAKHNTLVSSVS